MEINYNAISLVDTLGLIQGVVLGFLLILMNKKKKKSTLFLGLFILAYALELLPIILKDLGITEHYPRLSGLPLSFGWLLFPLFYVYVQQISILSTKRPSYWTLVPGLLFFLVNGILFFQEPSVKLKLQDSIWYDLFDLGGFFFGIFIGFKTLGWIKKHIHELKNQYTTTEFKDLKWARLFILFGLTFTFVVVIADVFGSGFYFGLTISVLNVILLYWISVRGIMQQNVPTLVALDKTLKVSGSSDKNQGTVKPEKNKDGLLEKVNAYILKTDAYTQADLTIVDIAKNVGVHPKRISGAINSQLDQNFNTYINTFRIEKAITMLENDMAHSLSIEGIANEVGFQSRSTFYTAFKKVTGTTPSLYKGKEQNRLT